ncbi:MAG TPA: hypothetical protein VHA73_00675 [Acidimicrobiales bacterium]|nr:hypothetical protein [Acidimicrobiales bacterium]
MRSLTARGPAFFLAMGIAVGAILTGLVVPYVRTEKVATTPAAATGTLGQTGGATGDTIAGVAGTGTTTAGGGTGPAAGGGSSGGGAAGGGAAATGGGGPGGSNSNGAGGTARGVTKDTIKLGIAIIDVGAAKSLGYSFDLGDQRARYDALIADVNRRGGINGRKLVADYRTVDAAARPVESEQAACVAWTQDVKVFAVLAESQWGAPANVCVTGQGHTLLFSTDGVDQSYYANGLFFSTQASDNRILLDHAHYLQSKGKLEGKTIGVLVGDGSERLSIDDTLVPTLKQMGYSVKDVEVVPQSIAGTQKIPIAVSNFKAAGVDLIIMAANVILDGPFAQAAHRAGYDPEYALSDFNNEINDQVASYYPDAFDGTVALSTHRFPEYRAGMPVPPADKHCFDRVGKADPKVIPFINSAHEVGLGECAIFDAFVNAATKAGPDLTQASFIQGANSLGTFAIPSTQDGSFAPGKHDAVDYEREVAWHKSCKCWELVPGSGLRKMG